MGPRPPGTAALFYGAFVLLAGAIGALHIGPDRRYLLWTAWAVGAGFVFGALYGWTGGILAPVVAHALHNGVTLLLWKRSRTDGRASFGGAA